jgi:hypothetical protein
MTPAQVTRAMTVRGHSGQVVAWSLRLPQERGVLRDVTHAANTTSGTRFIVLPVEAFSN